MYSHPRLKTHIYILSPNLHFSKHMGYKNWTVFRKLNRAVNKIAFLLNFHVHQWRIASILSANSHHRSRSLSFNDRTGLRDFNDQNCGIKCYQRTRSYARNDYEDEEEEEDVDKRAERFISNFHRQLRYERQISMDLRYCRGKTFDK